MNKQQTRPANSSSGDHEGSSPIRGAAPMLLFAASITMGVGYNVHLAGFAGWVTLVIAGASLFVAAVHWLHLRTTNAIESAFATVKARTRTTKGAGSRDAGLAMAFKLLTQAERHWRRVGGGSGQRLATSLAFCL